MKVKRMAVSFVLLASLTLSALGQDPGTRFPVHPDRWTLGPDADWKVYWDDALVEAGLTGKKLFVLVSGSDWCGWCVRLRDDVLLTKAFKEYAKKNFVLLYLDRPQKRIPDDQRLHNNTICRALGIGCCVPFVVIFDADSRCRGAVAGYLPTAGKYIERIENAMARGGELPKSEAVQELFANGYASFAQMVAAEKSKGRQDGWKWSGTRSEPCDSKVDGESAWYYETFSNGGETCARIVAGDEKYAGDLTIPSVLDGYPVTQIDSRAFYRCSELRSVSIPPSVTSIGNCAFSHCSGFKAVAIPMGVTHIGDSAFEHCSGLNIVIVPSSVKKIGYHAFAKCPRVGMVYAFGIDASRMKSKLTRSGLAVGEVRIVEVKHAGRERE